MNLPSILVIDDEPDNFDVIETLLSDREYKLHYAVGGQEALARLDNLAPDLILLDVMMPGMDGIEVCGKIKTLSRWRFIPIIMVTALNEKEDLARCLEAGADDFISKPVNPLELRSRIRSTLRIKEQYDTIQEFSRLQKDTINILGRNLEVLTHDIALNFPHELNTPLTGILGTVEFLKNHLETLSISHVREILDWLDDSARHLENLTKKFQIYLELELEAHRQPREKHPRCRFSAPVIEEVLTDRARESDRVNDLGLAIEEADIAFPERYLTILSLELVDNALKFSSPGRGVTFNIRVRGESLNISVHDSGWGMTPEQIANIGFLRQFEREIHARQGLGMGLTIVKKIVELAGGEFSIASVYQRETTVNLSLPIVRD